MYIITRTGKHKRARRHIVDICRSLKDVKNSCFYEYAHEISNYTYELFTGNWKFICNLAELDKIIKDTE